MVPAVVKKGFDLDQATTHVKLEKSPTKEKVTGNGAKAAPARYRLETVGNSVVKLTG